MTPPFLGNRRLLIIEGLLGRFQRGERGRREAGPDIRPWSGLPTLLQNLPDTTFVVFNEGTVGTANPLLRLLRNLVTIHDFPRLRGPELARWVLNRVRDLGGSIDDGAAQALIATAGEDLWVLQSELEKLTLYAESQPITTKMVNLLTSGAREATVFELVNMMVAHRRADALRVLNQLLEQGEAPAYLLFMIARQFRQLLRAVDLLGTGAEEARTHLGVSERWQAERALRQAREYGREGLLAAHGRLVEADFFTKSGKYSAEMALELLVVELSSARISPAPPFVANRTK
jgi:DNA polymerase-3 subunit delta